jgi:hypothetical protein
MGVIKNNSGEAYKPLTCLIDSNEVKQLRSDIVTPDSVRCKSEAENVEKWLERSTFVVDAYIQQLGRQNV